MRRALYRSYRPRRFCEVVGQDPVCTTLKNQIAAGKQGHAYIFTGIRGTGKTTLAKILAKAVNCPNTVGGEPCGECEICKGIDSGAITDVTEIDAASNNGVDNIRDLRDESSYTPVVCKKRVYIIDEVHMLSGSAWAAMLKIMEEPPEHVMFILATTEIQKVPATILSRCQRFDLHRITVEGLVSNLLSVSEKEGIEIEKPAAAMIARLADGAMRDALSLLETCASGGEKVTEDLVRTLTGMVDRSYLADLVGDFGSGDIASAIGKIDSLYKDSMDPARLAAELVKEYRNVLMAKIGAENALSEYSQEEKADFRRLASSFDREEILRCIGIFTKLYDTIANAPDRRLALEISVMQACAGKQNRNPAEDPDIPPWENGPAPRVQAKPLPAKEPKPEIKPIPAEPEVKEPEPIPYIPEEPAKENFVPELPPEPKKTEPLPEGIREVTDWPKVVDAMRDVNGLFYGFLLGTRAYLTPKHLLIEGSEVFFSFMRENKSDIKQLKEVISRELGISLPIGPYKKEKIEEKPQPAKRGGLEEFIDAAKKSGIPIDFI